MIRPKLRALVALALFAALPALGQTVRRSAPAATPASPAPFKMTKVAAPAPVLPDTVLARVYGAQDVTWTRLVKGVRKLGGGISPESLTPDERRQVLNVLVDQSILNARVARDARDWKARDSSEYRVLRDRLLMNAALDSALFELASTIDARGDTVPSMQKMGVMLRDSLMARVHPKYDDWSLRHLAAAFAALPKIGPDLAAMQKVEAMGKLPSVAKDDSGRIVLACDIDTMTVSELLVEYSRLNPIYRPRIEDEGGVVDLIGNVVYENLLRRRAEQQGFDGRKSIRSQLDEKAQYLDVARFVQKNVYAKIAQDSATLRRHYAAHPDWFHSPGTIDVVRMVFDTRAEANQLGERLRVPGEAESLATKSLRERVPYAATLNQDADDALYKRLARMGVGAIAGPDSTQQGWRIMKVMAIHPPVRLTFDKGYERVKTDWYEREGERLMRSLLDELRTHTIVVVNEKAPYLKRPVKRTR